MLFEAKIKIKTISVDGELKVYVSKYIVKGETCTDVEATLVGELAQYAISGEFSVESISKLGIQDIVGRFDELTSIYKMKASMRYTDEKQRIKRDNYYSFVFANTIDEANEISKNHLKGFNDYWLIDSIVETKIVGIL